jgi:hypothetical protein
MKWSGLQKDSELIYSKKVSRDRTIDLFESFSICFPLSLSTFSPFNYLSQVEKTLAEISFQSAELSIRPVPG